MNDFCPQYPEFLVTVRKIWQIYKYSAKFDMNEWIASFVPFQKNKARKKSRGMCTELNAPYLKYWACHENYILYEGSSLHLMSWKFDENECLHSRKKSLERIQNVYSKFQKVSVQKSAGAARQAEAATTHRTGAAAQRTRRAILNASVRRFSRALKRVKIWSACLGVRRVNEDFGGS